MGYWKIEPKYSSYAYRSKRIWWQLYKSAAKYYSFGMSWSPRQKILSFNFGRWQMNFIFPQKENIIETV